jgi:Hint domain
VPFLSIQPKWLQNATTAARFCHILIEKCLGNPSENVMKLNTVGRESGNTLPTQPVYTPESKVGFASGTIILTQEGEIPVEFLCSGDRIISRGTGFATLDQINSSRCMVRAVRFVAGSLGHTRPDLDLILPENQMVLVRDWRAQSLFGVAEAVVSAGDLIDGEFICDLGFQPMMLHQLRFARPSVIYAGGLEVMGTGAEIDTNLRAAA